MEITWQRIGGSVRETIEYVLNTRVHSKYGSLLMPRPLDLPGPASSEFQWPPSLHGSSSDRISGNNPHPRDSLPVRCH